VVVEQFLARLLNFVL